MSDLIQLYATANIRIAELERENAALKKQANDEFDTVITRNMELERENAALRAALDQQANYQRELRADRDRLDWLAVTDVWFVEPATESYTPETFRAEIDRIMKEAQP